MAAKPLATLANITWVLLLGAVMLDQVDERLLPSSMRAMEHDLGLSPSLLGSLTLAQALAKALSLPLWGYLADRGERCFVMCAGCVVWGLATGAMGCVSGFWWLMVLRALNGLALSSVAPVAQSMVADLVPPESRGRAFGLLEAAGGAASAVGGVSIAWLAGLETISGISGWRVAFGIVAVLSLAYGALLFTSFREPPRVEGRRRHSVVAAIRQIFATKTYLLIVLQGVVGSIPWSAMAFLVMWFQYMGFDSYIAGALVSSMSVGMAFGGGCAGVASDHAAIVSPNHGRLLCAQVASLARIMLVFVIFKLIPQRVEMLPFFAVSTLLLGFLMPWPAVAGNKPILSEVVEPGLRSSVIAYNYAIEGCSAAFFGAPLVGYLSEDAFGYHKGTEALSAITPEVRAQNAQALGHAMYIMVSVPWVTSVVLYTLIHFTYRHDRDAVRNSQHV